MSWFGAVLSVLDKALALVQAGERVYSAVSPAKRRRKKVKKLGNQRIHPSNTNPHAGRRH